MDKTKALRAIILHCQNVKTALRKVINDLTEEAETHDAFKLSDDEFEAVIHYQKLDGLAYGSEDYIETMNEIKPYTKKGWNLHVSRYSHHPEHFKRVKDMPLMDIIKMVCDWKGANATYNSSGQTFRESAEICMEKYNFSKEQQWAIKQMINFLED